jgi:hypothetical protein
MGGRGREKLEREAREPTQNGATRMRDKFRSNKDKLRDKFRGNMDSISLPQGWIQEIKRM